MHATIRVKLIASFLVLLLLVSFLGWMGTDQMGAMNRTADELYLTHSQAIFAVKDVKNDLQLQWGLRFAALPWLAQQPM